MPADTNDRMFRLAGAHNKPVLGSQRDLRGFVRGVRVAVDDVRPSLNDLSVTHFDRLRRPCVVQEIAVLPVRRLGSLHMERVDRHGVDRDFIVAMLSSTEVVVVTHFELTGRNQREAICGSGRRPAGNIRIRSRDALTTHRWTVVALRGTWLTCGWAAAIGTSRPST